jgi:hypothetical protein
MLGGHSFPSQERAVDRSQLAIWWPLYQVAEVSVHRL